MCRLGREEYFPPDNCWRSRQSAPAWHRVPIQNPVGNREAPSSVSLSRLGGPLTPWDWYLQKCSRGTLTVQPYQAGVSAPIRSSGWMRVRALDRTISAGFDRTLDLPVQLPRPSTVTLVDPYNASAQTESLSQSECRRYSPRSSKMRWLNCSPTK